MQKTARGGVGLLLSVAGAVACSGGDLAQRPTPVRGTVGEETFGVLCDRIGANALHEDLSGASYSALCHRPQPGGAFGDEVDQTRLPPNPNRTARAAAVARVEALVPRRADLISALDAVIPAGLNVPVHSGPGTSSCTAGGSRPFSSEVAALLSRLGPSYDDGTLPEGTRSIARLLEAVQGSPDALAALARLGARAGYRQEDLALGALRPMLAYPGLRDLLVQLSRLLSVDSQPGGGAEVPGPLVPLLQALTSVAANEATIATASAPAAPLSSTLDATVGIARLSRPRTFLETLGTIVTSEDPVFGGGAPRPMVRRDVRGVASVVGAGGAVAAPFVDSNADGLPDLDANGYFVTSSGEPAPSPFKKPWSLDTAPRDPLGRALGTSGAPLYATLDANQTYASSLTRTLRPLLNPDATAEHETLMDALSGATVLFGARSGPASATKSYVLPSGTTVTVAYDAFDTSKSPALDLAYSAGQLAADPSIDAVLATAGWLMKSQEPLVAELAHAAFATKATWDATPSAALPSTSTLPDELLDVAAQIAAVRDADGTPGLLSDVFASLSEPAAAGLGDLLASLATNKDLVDYNRNEINGPPLNISTGVLGAGPSVPTDLSSPITGANRSLFYRFLQLIHDARGVSVCNRDGATVKAVLRVPVIGSLSLSIPDSPLVTAFWGKNSFGECEVFKMDDAALFYMQAIVGKAAYVIRDRQLRNGVSFNLGVTTVPISATKTTVQVLQDSSGLTGYQPPGTTDPTLRTGFFTDPSSTNLLTRPEWLNRGLFLPNGVGAPAIPAFQKSFADALNPLHAGTSVCPTRDVKDPLPPSDPNYTKGGIIHLPACADGDWLDQRDADTVFALETNGFYKKIAPLITPFTNRGRGDLLVALLDALYKHWPDASATTGECKLDAKGAQCSREGGVHFEPVVATALGTGIHALSALSSAFTATGAPSFYLSCATRDTSGVCHGASVPGTRVLAEVAAQALDPNESRRRGLRDRKGNKYALRNDGTTNAQVTPVYLLTGALSGIDAAWSAWNVAHPNDVGRKAQWLRARSQLVDQIFSVNRVNDAWSFSDAALPAVAPTIVTTLRQQLLARCPEWPGLPCVWVGSMLTSDFASTLGGPLFATSVDLVDAIRSDAATRAELEALASYLLDDGSGNAALASLLATSDDMLQWLGDDTNLVPILHSVGAALAPAPGHRNLVDAQIALISRLTERVYSKSGEELCGAEVDPNQVLTLMLQGLATPTALPSGALATPLEVFGEVISDVNRVVPSSAAPIAPSDLGRIATEVVSFLTDETSGLEQLYGVVKNATE